MTSYNSIGCFFTHACPRQGTATPSYVFFQRGQLLIQSHLVCPKRKCPLLSVRRARWELPGPCRLCYQLLCGIDDFQDFCGDVAERDSRILLFGSITEGDRRQEQHINNDVEIPHYHGAHREIASIITDNNINVPKEQEAKHLHSSRGLRGGLICLGLAFGTHAELPQNLREEKGKLKRKLPCLLPTAESFISITSLSG